MILSQLQSVRAMAFYYSPYDKETQNDLYQEGCVGLCYAADDYDPGRCAKFSTFAYMYVKRFMIEYLRERSSVIRFPRKYNRVREVLYLSDSIDGDGTPVEDILVDGRASQEDIVIGEEERKIGLGMMEKFRAGLSDRDKQIWDARLVYNDDPVTELALGQVMGITECRVNQVETGLREAFLGIESPKRRYVPRGGENMGRKGRPNRSAADHEMDEAVGQRLREARKGKGYSMRWLAEIMGWKTVSRVIQYECARAHVSDENLALLSTVLEVNPEWLRTGWVTTTGEEGNRLDNIVERAVKPCIAKVPVAGPLSGPYIVLVEMEPFDGDSAGACVSSSYDSMQDINRDMQSGLIPVTCTITTKLNFEAQVTIRI